MLRTAVNVGSYIRGQAVRFDAAVLVPDPAVDAVGVRGDVVNGGSTRAPVARPDNDLREGSAMRLGGS